MFNILIYFIMMKKFSFMFATAAIVAGGMLTVSCSDSDNEAVKEVVVKKVELDDVKTIQLTSNVDTKFTIGNVSKTGKVVEFEVNGNTATIKAEVEGYVPQEATIDFSKNQNAAAIVFDMVKKSTNLVPQEDAKGHSVASDAANQKATGVVSAIEVPADVVITGNTTDPFAITTFVPAPEVIDLDGVKKNVEVKVPVLGFECDPDGALFDKPVTLSAVIPGIEGFDISVPGAKNLVREGDKISFTVDHFSSHMVEINAIAEGIIRGNRQLVNVTVETKGGLMNLPFNMYSGFTLEGADISGLWNLYGTAAFGSPLRTVGSSIDMEVDGVGTLNVVIEQDVEKIALRSGTHAITMTVMHGVNASAKGQPTHSSGEANAQ